MTVRVQEADFDTGAELDLPVGGIRRDVVEHTLPHRLDVGDETVALRGAPDERIDGGDQVSANSISANQLIDAILQQGDLDRFGLRDRDV